MGSAFRLNSRISLLTSVSNFWFNQSWLRCRILEKSGSNVYKIHASAWCSNSPFMYISGISNVYSKFCTKSWFYQSWLWWKILYETTEDSIIGPSSPSMVWIIYDSTASEENRFQINIFLGMHTLMTWNLKVLLNIKTGSSKLTFIMLIYHQILHEILVSLLTALQRRIHEKLQVQCWSKNLFHQVDPHIQIGLKHSIRHATAHYSASKCHYIQNCDQWTHSSLSSHF